MEKAIICVDDEQIILNSLGAQLKRAFGAKYIIETADGGTEAIELCIELIAEGIEIPLIISDQNMKGMLGNQLLTQLHNLYPQTLKILLTGETDGEVVRNLVNISALYRYIAKPWDETDLVLTVQEALRCYEQNQKLIFQNDLLTTTNQKLEESVNLLIATLEATADGILVLDSRGKVLRYNQKFLNLLGIAEMVAQSNRNCIIDLALQQLLASYSCSLDHNRQKNFLNPDGYSLLELKNGKVLECYSQIQKLKNTESNTVWSFRDVTERYKAEQTIKHQAFHDSLTGLANRNYFDHHLASELKKSQDYSHKLAVLFFDLDRFKNINDSLGHAFGDRLLKEVVKRLKISIRDEDIISRWGGDEFTLLLPRIKGLDDAIAIAKRILKGLQPSFNVGNHRLHITSSIGIAIYPDHGTDSDTLLKNADAALYKAKDQGRNNYQYYNQNLNSQGEKLLQLENKLRYALAKREFVLYYQPIVDVVTNRIVKMEALLRWQNDTFGLIPPDSFIPLAEDNGLIIPIGKWVLKQACLQNKYWQQNGFPWLKVSVNLSPKQFQEPNLVNKLLKILKKTNLNPCDLELEITETVTIQNGSAAKTILNQLNLGGISLSMDDFGTGYSSLSYLKQFPFNTLKIDRFFVQNALNNPEDQAIIKAIVHLGKGLNISVVAEGIETEESKNFLQTLGCRYMQGYYFSRPVPAQKATQLLQSYSCMIDLSEKLFIE